MFAQQFIFISLVIIIFFVIIIINEIEAPYCNDKKIVHHLLYFMDLIV
ncbi:hypothetical protein Mgra_00008392 [Meloidogyne graminicola]|uniref:Uncharacterized protein n=1 Tax=Meloidogyne graminicola TaxID=189291 RepID=A0A8S9ZFZ2_9BILA|nr:hypothetical protein Mgra_00008392 [Meloidogyne graminicola]